MNILLIGSGGREHAIAWALQKSPNTDVLYVAPGNGGTAEIAENVDLDIADGEALLSFVHERNIGLVVIGPEAPLVDGVADLLRADGVPVFGPNADGAQLEGSKAYSQGVHGSQRHSHGRLRRASTTRPTALAYVREQGAPIVIKADGLAAGKGVVVAETVEDAEAAVRACFDGAFGDAGSTVVIEECMTGPECSLLCFVTAGQSFPMAPAQDHKRAYDGDLGPNTGGMGVYSPVPIVTDRGDGCHGGHHGEGGRRYGPSLPSTSDYRGTLYGGFMLTPRRPEDRGVQRALRRPRDAGGAAAAWKATWWRSCSPWPRDDPRTSQLEPGPNDWAVSVVLASEGYPGCLREGQGHPGYRRGRGAARRDGLPCGHPPQLRRRAAHQRRPRAERGG